MLTVGKSQYSQCPNLRIFIFVWTLLVWKAWQISCAHTHNSKDTKRETLLQNRMHNSNGSLLDWTCATIVLLCLSDLWPPRETFSNKKSFKSPCFPGLWAGWGPAHTPGRWRIVLIIKTVPGSRPYCPPVLTWNETVLEQKILYCRYNASQHCHHQMMPMAICQDQDHMM